MPRQRENWKANYREFVDYAHGPVTDILFSGIGAGMPYGDETLAVLIATALNSATDEKEKDKLVRHYSTFKREYLGQMLDDIVDEVTEAKKSFEPKHAELEAKFDALVKRISEDPVAPTLQQALAETEELRAASEKRTARLIYQNESLDAIQGLIYTLQQVEEKLQKPFQDERAPDNKEASDYAEEAQKKIPAQLEQNAAWREKISSVAELVETRRLRDFRDYLKNDGVAAGRDLEAPVKASFAKKPRSFG